MSSTFGPPNPNQPSTISIVKSTAFSEQMREKLGLTSEPRDQLILELAGEVDNLADCITNLRNFGLRAQCSSRRVIALNALHTLIQLRETEKLNQNMVSVVASILREVKKVMIDNQIPTAQVTTMLYELMDRIQNQDAMKTVKAPS